MQEPTHEAEVLPRMVEIAQTKRAVQELISTERFQRAVTAHRLVDMSSHSVDLYRHFPDYAPPEGVLQQLERATGGRIYTFTEDQRNEFMREMFGVGDSIRSAWMFAAALDSAGNYHTTVGHPIRSFTHPGEAPGKELSFHSMRGMFIKLGGKFDGVEVMQLDAGDSRQLFDLTPRQELYDKMVGSMAGEEANPYSGAGWLDHLGARRSPLLIICNEKFKIEDAVDINRHLKRINRQPLPPPQK